MRGIKQVLGMRTIKSLFQIIAQAGTRAEQIHQGQSRGDIPQGQQVATAPERQFDGAVTTDFTEFQCLLLALFVAIY